MRIVLPFFPELENDAPEFACAVLLLNIGQLSRNWKGAEPARLDIVTIPSLIDGCEECLKALHGCSNLSVAVIAIEDARVAFLKERVGIWWAAQLSLVVYFLGHLENEDIVLLTSIDSFALRPFSSTNMMFKKRVISALHSSNKSETAIERLFSRDPLGVYTFVGGGKAINDAPNVLSAEVLRALGTGFQRAGLEPITALTAVLALGFSQENFSPWNLASLYNIAIKVEDATKSIEDIHIDQYDVLLSGRQLIQSPESVWKHSEEVIGRLTSSRFESVSGIFIRVAVNSRSDLSLLSGFLAKRH